MVFPPLQTEQASFPALRFPVGPSYFDRADLSFPTVERTSGTKPPSSAFSTSSVGDQFLWLTLAAFTVSAPLQNGVWLLCCLCPPSHALAFSHPSRVEWYRSSLIPIGDL